LGPLFAAPAFGDSVISDPFRTDELLQERTPLIRDPRGRECAPPSAATTLPFGVAVDLALCRNPLTHSAWAAAREQSALVGVSESAWLPGITGTGSETRTTGGIHVDAAGNYVTATQDTGDAAISLSWTVYDFGARTGRITSARKLLDAAAASASYTTQQVVLAVAQAFYGVVEAEAAYDATKKAEANYEYVLQIAQGLQKGGVASLSDVLQVQTALDQAVIQRVAAEGDVKNARGTLAVTLGLRADEQYLLVADPVPIEMPGLRARMAELLDKAIAQRPDLAAAQAQRDSAEADVQVAQAQGWPTISLNAGRSSDSTSGLPHQSYNTIGLSISIPVFTGFNSTYNIRHAKAALESTEANLDQTRLGVTRDVWNGYYTLDTANKQLGTTTDLVKTALKNEEVALGQYQAGVTSILNVLIAETAAITARQQRILAEYTWQVSRAQFVLALGVLYNAEPLGKNLPSLP
jgi:outer membrane protein TolC